MSEFVTTRLSLLLRIRDSQDAESWSDFVRIYAPLIYRYSRRMGLQDADAADLTQEVLQVVTRAIGQFDYDRDRGRFRGWLKTVAFHTCSQMKKRAARQPVAIGDTGMDRILDNQPVDPDPRFWDQQYTRRMFELAAERVRPTVQEATWEAFLATAIRGEAPASVAQRLRMKVGTVYVARARVYNRIQQALRDLNED